MFGTSWRRSGRVRNAGRTRRRRAGALALVGVGVSSMLPWSAGAAGQPGPHFVTGWGQMSGSASMKNVIAYPGVFAEVSPFGYVAAGATTLNPNGSATNLANAITALHTANLPIVPTVTDGMGKLGMATMLDDPTQRSAHVQALVQLVTSNGYDGVDLDYEDFAFADGKSSWDTTKPDWVAFVQALGDALHAQGKLLSITVPPIWGRGTKGYPVYDWTDIIGSVDRLRLMVYEWSGSSPGPNAPMSWVTDILDTIANSPTTTASYVPAAQRSKVQIGVPAYGKNWSTIVAGKQCPGNVSLGTRSVQMKNAAALAQSHNVTPQRDPNGWDELTFQWDETATGPINAAVNAPDYVPPPNIAPVVDRADTSGLAVALRIPAPGTIVTCTIRHTVYVPDVQSIVDRANATLQAGLSGIAVWALGYDDDALWPALAQLDARHPAGTSTAGAFEAAQVTTGGLHVRGWVLDPELDLPLTVTVTVGPTTLPLVARLQRDDVAQAVAGADPLHGFDATLNVAAAPGQQVCVDAHGWGADATPWHQCLNATT